MNRKIVVDQSLEQDVNRLMVCAPLNCSRQGSCFRVARFARDKIREMHFDAAMNETEVDCERYGIDKLHQDTGAWEAA